MSPERIKNYPYGFPSDIWSFGLVMMECATGRYPFQECSNCIEMAQTILDADLPELPRSRFSYNCSDFLNQCLRRDPNTRLPAEVLLGAPWLEQHGATSPDAALRISSDWIRSLVGSHK
jgi:serine/threonine protein kinase